MNVPGSKTKVLCSKAGHSKSSTSEAMVKDVKSQMSTDNLSSVHVETEPEKAAETDAKVKELIKYFEKYAGDSSVVVYLIVEEEDSVANHRRLTSRRLEDED